MTVDGWEGCPLTVAAQRVQISAYPDAYAKHEAVATQIVNLLADGAARAVGNIDDDGVRLRRTDRRVRMDESLVGQASPGPRRGVGSGFRTAERPTHQGVDLILERYTADRCGRRRHRLGRQVQRRPSWTANLRLRTAGPARAAADGWSRSCTPAT